MRNFLGKTQADARRMFVARRGGFTTEDFMGMAAEGLRYYLAPAREYLMAEESRDDWEFCHGLLCSLSCQARHGDLPPDVLRQIREIADYADTHRAKYQFEPTEADDYIQEIREASS